jgi:hypothetical protein
MKRRPTLFVALVLVANLASGSPMSDFVAAGVYGVKWGASIDEVVAVYPQGDHVFSTAAGCRSYWVKDKQLFAGIPREANGMLVNFDERNLVSSVSIGFSYEWRLGLRDRLVSMWGEPQLKLTNGGKTSYGWGRQESYTAVVTEFGSPTNQIIWLSLGPITSAKNAKPGC